MGAGQGVEDSLLVHLLRPQETRPCRDPRREAHTGSSVWAEGWVGVSCTTSGSCPPGQVTQPEDCPALLLPSRLRPWLPKAPVHP